MTYAMSFTDTSFTDTSFTETAFTENVPDSGSRLTRFMADLTTRRARRNERVSARRTALAMSEEARIHAQMSYRRMRYRHMAS